MTPKKGCYTEIPIIPNNYGSSYYRIFISLHVEQQKLACLGEEFPLYNCTQHSLTTLLCTLQRPRFVSVFILHWLDEVALNSELSELNKDSWFFFYKNAQDLSFLLKSLNSRNVFFPLCWFHLGMNFVPNDSTLIVAKFGQK